MREDLEVSLEEIISFIKIPPLTREFYNGSLVLISSEKKKFKLLKKSYEDSFKKIISSKNTDFSIEFRHFIKRYNYFFGEEIFNFMNNLNKKSIEYIIGTLKFEENIKEKEPFVAKSPFEYTH